MSNHQGTCPACGSHHISYGTMKPYGDNGLLYVHYCAHCCACGKPFEENYELEYKGADVVPEPTIEIEPTPVEEEERPQRLLTASQLTDMWLVNTHPRPEPADDVKQYCQVWYLEDDDDVQCGKVYRYITSSDQYCISRPNDIFGPHYRKSTEIFNTAKDASEFAIHQHLQAMHEILGAIQDGDIKGELEIARHLALVENHKRAIRFIERSDYGKLNKK